MPLEGGKSESLFGPDYQDLIEGQTLTNEQASNLEHQLEENPHNLRARLQLIGYYRRRRDELLQKRFEHLLWMIENYPHRIAWRQRVLMGLSTQYPPNLFAQAREHWLDQIAQHPNNPEVLGNAGLFLIERDFERGEELLSRASELQPADDFWSGELSRFCYWQAKEGSRTHRHMFASKALKFGEKFLELYGVAGGRATSAVRASVLQLCAQCAFWLGDLNKSASHAFEHLKLVEKWQSVPKSSQSILGLVSLRMGDLKSAKRHLLSLQKESQLDEWDLQLANELVRAGEIGTVIRYLRECKQLGHWQRYCIDEWINSLSRGKKIKLA